MSERVLPTAPGYWWCGTLADPYAVQVLEDEHSTLVVEVNYYSNEPVAESRHVWICPVPPPGSISPDVHARAVRDAFDAGSESGVAYVRGEDSWSQWDARLAALHATLTDAGLTPEAAADIVREVSR